MAIELIVVTLGGFVASFVNAAFATGGIYIVLATSTAVFPVAVAVPLQSVFAMGSLVARIIVFWQHIHWPVVMAFASGSVIGVYLGGLVFVSLPEGMIAILLGLLLLTLIWMPSTDWRPPFRHPFALVGIAHSFLGTVFGVGALLQPTILRTSLGKLAITATLAACLAIMDVFKLTAYIWHGFDYRPYLPHIALAIIAGFLGTWCGKRVSHKISESVFRTVFKWLVTLVALQLLYRGAVFYTQSI